MKEDAVFEAICLGGDDLLIVVPADVSLDITNGIIDNFDKDFDYQITISAGICIAKSTTPIQNMLTISQDCLKSAKRYEKRIDDNCGTLDVIAIGSNHIWNWKERNYPVSND